ncbi:MAG: NAD(P)H:quinone oxidoreductase [Gammaproteobacteria bacterium]|nr:MAG: NAD(P)H:quinone oxidoreductase [Gammaproteobacteria bacterium]
MKNVLVLYYSRNGSTAALAGHVARGVERVEPVEVLLRTVPTVSPITEATAPAIPDDGPPHVTLEEVAAADGLIIGSPTRFGKMAAPLKYLLDSPGELWLSGALSGKPAAVFTSTGTMHGGQESTLLTMMLPLLHHGMVLVGLPFTDPTLGTTRTGGTPYGASHVAGQPPSPRITEEERLLAQALGERVARIALILAGK